MNQVLTTYTWLYFFPLLSAFFLRLAYTNLHNNGYTSNHLIWSFLSEPLYSHRISTTKILTSRPQNIGVTTLFTAPLPLPPHPTTHTHNPTLLTHVLFQTSQFTFPSLVNPHRSLKHISRHTHASPRLFRASPAHTLHCLPAKITRPRWPAQSNFLPPPSTPPLGQHAASRLSSAILFLKTLRILCLCLSQLRTGEGEKMRAVALPGADAPRYNILTAG